MSDKKQLDAAWLAGLFRDGTVMDIFGAAKYLGIERHGVKQAVMRGRLSCVELANKKLFTKVDLDAYRENIGHGKYGKPIQAIVHRVGGDDVAE